MSDLRQCVCDFSDGRRDLCAMHRIIIDEATKPLDIEIARLRARCEDLERWVDDLQSGLYINCVYCGHRYGPGEGDGPPREALHKHVAECPRHPLSKANAELARLRARVEELEKQRETFKTLAAGTLSGLMAERDRLREALRCLVLSCDVAWERAGGHDYDEAMDAARAALAARGEAEK